MTTDTLLLKQPAASLQALCIACGIKKTGPKAVLVQRLRRAARNLQPLPPGARILSIDLGLRNFAFSLLSPAPSAPSGGTSTVSYLDSNHGSGPVPLARPVRLHVWQRLDLTLLLPIQQEKQQQFTPAEPESSSSNRPKRPESNNTSGPEPAKTSRADANARKDKDVQREEHQPPENEGKEEGDKGLQETLFSPASLAALAVSLARTRLLPLRPTHVLIERQRFRTGGGPAVAEWTLRVNTFEAALHAAFAALAAVRSDSRAPSVVDRLGGEPGEKDGAGDGDGVGGGGGREGGDRESRVHSVLPSQVAGFLFPRGVEGLGVTGVAGDAGEDEGGGGAVGRRGKGKRKGQGRSTNKALKMAKVDLLARWLEDGRMVVPETEQAREMTRSFLDGWAARGKRRKTGGRKVAGEGDEAAKAGRTAEVELVTKMDDLSDAVLQGMVWLQWQQNLERLVQERPELLDQKG